MPKRSGWSLRSSTGNTGPRYGPVSVKFNLNGRKVDFPAMITEGPECLLGADFLGTYKGLLSMQHSAIQFTLPDGTRTVVDCDGSAPCPDARRLVKVIRATETIRVEERAEVTVTVDVCAGRDPNWRYQVTPLPMTIAKRKRRRKGYPPPDKEMMVAHAEIPGTEKDLELRIINPSDRTCELPKGTALGELVVVPVQPTWMVAETQKKFEKVAAVMSALTATTSGAESTSTFKFPDLLKHLVTEAVTETEEARKKLAEILMDHKEAFSLNGEFGFIENFEHKVPTGDAIPIKQSPYRLPLWGVETVGKCLDEMINAKVAVKCRPGGNRMGVPRRTRQEKGRIGQILYRLPEIEQGDPKECSSDSKRGNDV